MSTEARKKSVRESCGRLRAEALAMIALSLTVGCGVEEHSRGSAAPLDSTNDFGPPTTAGGGGAVGVLGNGGAAPVGAGGTAGMAVFPPGSGGSFVSGGGSAGVAGLPTSIGGAPMSGVGGAAGSVGGAPVGAGGTAPLSGVTITLGTTTVAKENAIAFIHIGHSNMAGRATGPTATRPYFFNQSDPHAWMYHVGTPPQPALEPYTAEDDTSGVYGGPGTAIVKEAVALATGKDFISLGFGKESAYCSQFLPGALYYDTLMKAPLAIKDRVTFGAIVIMLGITERHGTAADVSGYSTCINTLVTAIRTDVGRPDLPLLITDYEQEATGTLAIDQPFALSIIPEIHKIPMVVSNSALVPTDGLGMQDDHHFNFDGHKLWVSRMLQIMKDKGWFPW
ncbi:MAG TPA: sialate O-acetylesterase [Polyangiaceae bacterium]|nr:sialate O-acetylesterase [Polyangiaceae bacterium]